MDILDIAKIASAIFAGVSVLFAIYTYRITSDRELYKKFRLSLFDIKNNIIELNDLLSNKGLIDFGSCISTELRELLPKSATKQEIIDYLKDPKHEDYINQAIHLGIQRSDIEVRSSKIITELRKVPVEYGEQFPILSKAFFYLIAFITTSHEAATSPDTLISSVFNSETLGEHLDEELDDISCTITLFRELAVWATTVADQMSDEVFGGVFESSQLIVNELVDSYAALSDRELRKFSSEQSKLKSAIEESDSDITEDMFNLLKLLKKHLGAESWDSIVSAKTKISLVFDVD